jgi:hypothetical protein
MLASTPSSPSTQLESALDSQNAATSETHSNPDTRTFKKFTQHRAPPQPPITSKKDESGVSSSKGKDLLKRHSFPLSFDEEDPVLITSSQSTTIETQDSPTSTKGPKHHVPSLQGLHIERPLGHKHTTPSPNVPTQPRSKSISPHKPSLSLLHHRLPHPSTRPSPSPPTSVFHFSKASRAARNP